ncbi:MAG: RHS repeat-associated core domain-containing protein [Myxococcota bacterium]
MNPLLRRLALLLGCALLPGCFPELPLGTPGHWDHQAVAAVPIPGGTFNAAALNTRFEHVALSIDTKVGANKTFALVYNSGTRTWQPSWEARFDGATFVDPNGTLLDVAGHPLGSAVPGSYWVITDADRVQTKGGLAFRFDASGRIASETWSRDGFPQLLYDWQPDELRVSECVSPAQQQAGQCRLVVRVLYGPDGPTEVIDEASAAAGVARRATYAYDGEGRLEQARTPRQQALGLPGTRFEYGPVANLITAQVGPDGERIEYDWAQTHLREVRQVGEGDPTHVFDYARDAAGDVLVTHTSPVAARTRYRVSPAGLLRSIERLDLDVPETLSILWHAGLRRPARVTGFDGTSREFPSWQDDDPAIVVEASGNTIAYTWAPDALNHADATRRPLRRVVDDLGVVLDVVYDPSSGLPQTRTNGAGETTGFVHVAGNVTVRTSPWGEVTEMLAFGASGHWLDAASSSAPEVTLRRKFDAVGNATIPVAGFQRGGVLESAWDRDRRLASHEVAVTDEDGAVTGTDAVVYERRGDGRPLAIRRPLGADHELQYDALGRVVRMCERVLGSCHHTVFEYDAAGRRTAVERPNGMREELDYDGYGRPVARRALRDGVLEGERRLRWESGRLLEVDDSLRGEVRSLAYDSAGRPWTESFSAHGETRVLAYDLRSRLVRETLVAPIAGGEPLTRVVGIDYDGADRSTRTWLVDGSPAGELLREREIVDGRVVAVVDGNGTVRERLFDPVTGRLVGYRTTDALGVVIEDTAIARSAEIGPTRFQVSTRTVTALATTEEEYWLNRPGSVLDPDGKVGMRVFRARGWDDGVLVHDRRWAWDATSNAVDNASGDIFVYNADRTRLASASGAGWSHTYAYDAAGFVTQRDGLEVAWTATGRVARVGPAAMPLARATWDLAGALVSVETDGGLREFGWFGGRVETDTADGGPGWLHIGDVSLPFAGAERRYRHADFRGNTSVVADEQGAIVSHRRHHAFGLDRVHGSSGSGGTGLLEQIVLSGFAGGVAAQGLALGFTGARVLDQDTGRFLSPDPILHALNQVTYAVGNPIGFEDRSGRNETAISAEAQARFDHSANLHLWLSGGITMAGVAFGSPALTLFGMAYGFGVLSAQTYQSGSRLDSLEKQSRGSAADAPQVPNRNMDMTLPRERRNSSVIQIRVHDPAAGLAPSPCAPLAVASGSHRVGWLLMLAVGLCLSLAARKQGGPPRVEHG